MSSSVGPSLIIVCSCFPMTMPTKFVEAKFVDLGASYYESRVNLNRRTHQPSPRSPSPRLRSHTRTPPPEPGRPTEPTELQAHRAETRLVTFIFGSLAGSTVKVAWSVHQVARPENAVDQVVKEVLESLGRGDVGEQTPFQRFFGIEAWCAAEHLVGSLTADQLGQALGSGASRDGAEPYRAGANAGVVGSRNVLCP